MQELKIEYRENEDVFEAYIAYDDSLGQKPLPAIGIFPAWNGRDHFAEEKARDLAQMGYIGCALDVYGKGKRGITVDECASLMDPLIDNRNLLKRRILAGLAMVASLSMVDKDKIGAIGFCFGGLCALDLARSGADVKGVVSFHGLLKAPEETVLCQVKSKVLALHGFDDPMVSSEEVLAFEKEMTARCVDWQLHSYGQVMHAFTNPEANSKQRGTLYSPLAAKRAWCSMQFFFEEIFAK